MKTNNTKTLLALALLTGGLASCSVEEQELPAEEQYAREFYKTFGVNGSTEGFNVVEQKSVKLNCSKPTHVQIYEKQAGEYRLAADYENVTEQTITFDGMKGDDSPFRVSCDGAMYLCQNGGTVTYSPQSSSSAKGPMRTAVIPDGFGSIVTKNTLYDPIVCQTGDKTFQTLSENDGKDNTATVTVSNAQYIDVKQGNSFTFYPAYWNSTKKHTVGIYYYDSSSNLHEIPVYTDKEGDELQFKVGTSDDFTTTLEGATDCWNYGDAGKVSYVDNFVFKAKGYTVTAQHDVAAGIYVEVDGKKYYSNAMMNDNKTYFAYRDCHQGSEQYSYLCFDDPSDDGGEGDRDFNDMVIFTKSVLTPSSSTVTGWTVACEDLGGTFDYDFNDVVFQVYYVSGQDWVRIIPLAAGGTLPVWLYYVDANLNEKMISKQEWHNHFGATEGKYKSSDMINTCYGGADYERSVLPIYIKTGRAVFSLKQFGNTLHDGGYFRLKVQRADGTMTSINAPGNNKEPQVLVLPVDWRWPKELVRINSIYQNFGQWGENYTNGTWVNTNVQNEDQLTEKNFYLHVVGRTSYEPKMD